MVHLDLFIQRDCARDLQVLTSLSSDKSEDDFEAVAKLVQRTNGGMDWPLTSSTFTRNASL